MLKGFKDFVLRGNVIDLSVAVVMGAAFGGIVSAFTDKIIKPLLNANHFSTSDIDAAYAAVGSGSLGKVVIDIRHS